MKNNRGIYVVFVLLTCVALWINCGADKSSRSDDDVSNTNFVASESFRFAVDAENEPRLRLEGINGNVEVTGLAGADSVIITGERRVGSESIEDAQNHLAQLQVDVSDLTNEVQVKTIQPDETHGRSYVVDYSITLPQTVDVVIKNVNGGVTIDSIDGKIAVQNVNGQVTLDEIIGSVSVSLVNGQIQAEVTPPKGGTISMATMNGGIGLDIPQFTSAQFSATVVNGTISISDLLLIGIVSTPTSLTGTLGTGEGTIALSAVNGSISVSGF